MIIINQKKYLLVTGFLFSIIFALLTLGCAQQGGHKQHNKHNSKGVCKKPGAIPTLNCALAPSAHFDRQGNLWVVWAHSGHIYVSSSKDKGQSFSPPVSVNRIPEKIYARAENRPKIAIDNNGNIYISWTQKLNKRFSGHIRFSRSIDGGRHFSDPITVNDHQEITSHRFDALAVNKKGHIYLAWLDKRDLLTAKKSGKKYNGAALYYAISTDGGQSFKKNRKVIDHTCQCCRVAIAIDTDQLPVVMWRHIFGDNIRDHALVKFKSQDQSGEPIRVSHEKWQVDGCPHHGPAISITENGTYHMTWFNNAPEHHGLFYANSSDQGKNLSIPLNFGDYKKAAAHPYVFSTGENVFLTWKEFNGKQSTLYVMESRNAGKHWTKPRRVATINGHSDHPFLLSDGHAVYISWHRRGQDYKLLRVVGLKSGK